MLAFVVTSTVSAIAGILLVARLGSAAYGGDGLIMMYSGAAVFLGMTILKSGKANIGGSIIGVGIIGVLSNGMNILQVNSYLQQVITGIIIILAVTFSAIKNRGRQ
jgi:ribose transport system permease protein